MDSIKFLRDDQYLFISEYISLHPNADQNIITFTIKSDKTFIKLFLESTEINLSLTKKGNDDPI